MFTSKCKKKSNLIDILFHINYYEFIRKEK